MASERMAIGGRGSRQADQFNLRLPKGLRDRIASHAKVNGRSANTEIVIALEEAFPEPIVPETVNERLLLAAKELMGDWSNVLASLGQDPTLNAALQNLTRQISEAEGVLRNA